MIGSRGWKHSRERLGSKFNFNYCEAFRLGYKREASVGGADYSHLFLVIQMTGLEQSLS